MAAYGDHERARRVAEPAKRANPGGAVRRGDFERDRARVLHSSALRRLAAKTQVVAPGEDDFPRTRLTHSLEVAQISREVGAALGCDPDVVDAAGLAHDLGHPPFGHNGEDALDVAAAACGGFEGNAQTLRVLTRLEAKALEPDGTPAGLNLTRATLDACCKYPWPRSGPAMRKFGVYAEDRPAFDWIRAGAPPGRRCLEAQVMDWADDVAYSVHDLEDGVHAGHIRLDRLADPDERAAVADLVAATYSGESAADLAAVLADLLALPPLADIACYDGSFGAQVALKRATSEIVERFAAAAVRATREATGADPPASTPGGARRRQVAGGPPLARYDADLVVPRTAAAECALLKGVALRYVMLRQAAEPLHAQQREVLADLVAALCERAPAALELALRPAWAAASGDAARLRVVVDQVARLTDTSARAWHARLTGPGRQLMIWPAGRAGRRR
jgi:dGTPase